MSAATVEMDMNPATRARAEELERWQIAARRAKVDRMFAVLLVIQYLAGILGVIWPESVYGVANAEWWRFLEHAGWVVFEDIFLIWSCIFGIREMKASAERQASIEHLSEQEQLKSAALEMALSEMQSASA